MACRPCFYQIHKHGVSAKELAKERGVACGICGLDVDLTLRKPDVMRASIDHIMPVARGGTNERSNLQLAHLLCNMRKGARLIS
jgi:5-methylcytosine-specific restriction endonuclease McrA